MKGELPLRMRIIHSPPGVAFGLQRGRAELVAPTHASESEVVFDLTVRVGDSRAGGLPNILGPFAQGPPAGRFLYVTSGTLAGQADSCWTRRAKVPLTTITWELVEEVLADATRVLEARIASTARDGGPACAAVPLLDGGWRVV